MADCNGHCNGRREDGSDGIASNLPPFEPVAIVGLGCRWPGGLDQPSKLWEFLVNKQHAYSDFPADRVNSKAFYHPRKKRPGSFYLPGGGFLDGDPYEFDRSFFGISAQEATSMDPSQRKLLEASYEAIESSGASLAELSGTKTGCFVGNFNNDHQIDNYRDAEFPAPQAVSGSSNAIHANRFSHIFNLRGPSMTLDTACSSSLIALHLACASIQLGDCEAALVGGSNLCLTPDAQIFSCTLGAVSATGRCHSFDKSADGYARSDGIGVLYVKKLESAIQNGDPIRAVIRGTAANTNGRTPGITHPNADGQERLIRHVFERARVNLDDLGYFECHGPGTEVGDPTEFDAMGRIFAAGRSPEKPLLAGSIKSNFGHTEAASGMAGIMKVILALENRLIPSNFGFNEPNPDIDFKEGRLKVVAKNEPWPDLPARIACLQSLGFGGSNAQCIVEAAETFLRRYQEEDKGGQSTSPHTNGIDESHTYFETYPTNGVNGSPNVTPQAFVDEPLTNGFSRTHMKRTSSGTNKLPTNHRRDSMSAIRVANGYHAIASRDIKPHKRQTSFSKFINGSNNTLTKAKGKRDQYLLTFSAHDLDTLKANILSFQESCGRWTIDSLAHTLSRRRTSLKKRCAIVASKWDLSDCLGSDQLSIREKSFSEPLRIGFVFTGQGAQWSQMGLDLMTTFPKFRETITYLDQVLGDLEEQPAWSIDAMMRFANDDDMMDPELAQSLTTAVQIALVELLKSWNIEPDCSVGHSSGEIAAAFAAGYLTIREAIIIAYLRGKRAARHVHDGLMLAVGKNVEELLDEVSFVDKDVVVACYNSPSSITLSGKAVDINAVKARLDEIGVFNRILKTGGRAYHSHFMDDIGFKYEQHIMKYIGAKFTRKSHSRRITFISSVTGSEKPEMSLKASYFRQNLESPVLFEQAIEELVHVTPVDVLLEIGPHAALKSSIQDIGKVITGVSFPDYLSTMIRQKDNVYSMLQTAGGLWSLGSKIDLVAVNGMKDDNSDQAPAFLTDLPRYQWQYRENLRRENRMAREWRQRMHPRHDLLGSRILGGLRDESTWRNILRLDDLPWMGDHRLSGQCVLPAAGFVCMAIEAAAQTYELLYENKAKIWQYDLESVKLEAPLIIPEDGHGIEVLTSMHRSSVAIARNAESTYEFRIVSVVTTGGDDTFVEHAKGQISLLLGSNNNDVFQPERNGFKTQVAADLWYDSFAQKDLNFGPCFQSLQNIKACLNSREAEAEVSLTPPDTRVIGESSYVIHPAVIDSFFQLTIIASHSGVASRLKQRYVPVSLEQMSLRPPTGPALKTHATVTAISETNGNLGFSSEIGVIGSDGTSIVKVKQLRTFHPPDETSTQSLVTDPFSRLIWRPSIRFLDSKTISQMLPPVRLEGAVVQRLNVLALHQLVQFHDTHPELFAVPHKLPHLQNLLDWVVRKREWAMQSSDSEISNVPKYSTWERKAKIAKLSSLLNAISSESRLMCHIYKNLPLIFSGELSGIQVALQDNRLNEMYETGSVILEGNKRLASIVDLIVHENSGMQMLEVGAGTGSATREILPILKGDGKARRYSKYVYTDITSSFLHSAKEKFKAYQGVEYTTFDMAEAPSRQGFTEKFDLLLASNVVHVTSDILSTLKNLRSLLRSDGKMALLEIAQVQLCQGITLGTFSDFWNGKNDPTCPRIDGPFMSKDTWSAILPQAGFSGADFFLDDYQDHPSSTVLVTTAVDDNRLLDNPMRSQPGITFIYRGELSQAASAFAETLSKQGRLYEVLELSEVSSLKYQLVVSLVELERPFFLDAKEKEWAGFKAVVNEKNTVVWLTNGGLLSSREPLYAMMSGIVRGLKTENSQLKMSMLDIDELDVKKASSSVLENILKVFSAMERETSGLYTLEYRSSKGLVHTASLSADMALNETWRQKEREQSSAEENTSVDKGNAAYKVDHSVDAEKHDLVTKEEEMMTLLNGDLEIAIKNRKPLNGGDHSVTLDLKELTRRNPVLISQLMDAIHGLNNDKARPPPPAEETPATVQSDFDIPDAPKAAEVAISAPPKQPSLFDPEAAYLLVGCLTGVGQLIAQYLLSNGARTLVFLSRSGDTKPEVQAFLNSIRSPTPSSASNPSSSSPTSKLNNTTDSTSRNIIVVRGSVTSPTDINRAILSTPHPIKGIIHGALTLHDRSLPSMSLGTFHATLSPRVQGTLNLHNLSQQHRQKCPLDFFLLLSSWTAIFGTATQSNYLASCTFMDAFAQYRRDRCGLPACSLVLSRIGNQGNIGRSATGGSSGVGGAGPRYAVNTRRNGFVCCDEDEFVGFVGAAIESGRVGATASGDGRGGQLLTGISPFSLHRLTSSSSSSSPFPSSAITSTISLPSLSFYSDRRFTSLIQSIRNLDTASASAAPAAINGTAAAGGTTRADAPTLTLVHTKLAQLLYLPLEKVDPDAPMARYGVDSMVAAEMRNWIVGGMGRVSGDNDGEGKRKVMGKDISLFKLLSPKMTVRGLAGEIDGDGTDG